jgi:hypothetical protein
MRLSSESDSSTTTVWLGGFNERRCTGLDGSEAGLPCHLLILGGACEECLLCGFTFGRKPLRA